VNDAIVPLIVWINAAANAFGRVALAPIAVLPGWLSATLVAVVMGVLMLVVFKYTSNQRAIKIARDEIKANLLALKLFKDSAAVALRAQASILLGAGRLAIYSIVPMLVMVVPVLLFMAQLAQWYQARPPAVGEDVIVTLKLNGSVDAPWPEVSLQPTPAIEPTIGPVRVQTQRALYWNVTARQGDYHRLAFAVDGQTVEKELAIGHGFLRTSPMRPGWNWADVVQYPAEQPFPPSSAVHSIAIDYPARPSWTSGTDWWIAYWFAMSMVAALCLRRALNVNI
jgi:hypothetical protein